MPDNRYYRATVTQTVVALAPDETEAKHLIQKHLPGRCIYGIHQNYGRFEVNGTATGLEIGPVVELSADEARRYLTRSQEVERQLKQIERGNT